MKTMIRSLVAGLIVGGTAHVAANAAELSEASLQTPITKIELDAEGNVGRIAFDNGDELDAGELALKPEEVELGNVEISGVRLLPFQVVKYGDSVAVIAEFAGATSVPLPPGGGAVLHVRQDGKVEVSLSAAAGCPPGWCQFYGECLPPNQCPKADVQALVEYRDAQGQVKLGLLSGTPEPSAR